MGEKGVEFTPGKNYLREHCVLARSLFDLFRESSFGLRLFALSQREHLIDELVFGFREPSFWVRSKETIHGRSNRTIDSVNR